MAQDPDPGSTEHFRPTSGRVTGVLALLLAAAVLLIGVLDRGAVAPWAMAAAALAGSLAWASMLRPALWVSAGTLVMRNMLETVTIPLAAIEEVAVRQVTAVRVGERRFVSTVVGRSLRRAVAHGRGAERPGDGTPATRLPYPDFVDERLHRLADDARAAAGVRRGSAEQQALAAGVRRQPAWLPIGLVAASTLALVLTLLR